MSLLRLLAFACLLELLACSSREYPCPDDSGGMFAVDPCDRRYLQTYSNLTYSDLSAGTVKSLPTLQTDLYNGYDSVSFGFFLDSVMCSRLVQAEYPVLPQKVGDTVRSALVAVTPGGQYLDSNLDSACVPPSPVPGASSWIVESESKYIPDDQGPRDGSDEVWKFEIDWPGHRLTGSLERVSKILHK